MARCQLARSVKFARGVLDSWYACAAVGQFGGETKQVEDRMRILDLLRIVVAMFVSTAIGAHAAPAEGVLDAGKFSSKALAANPEVVDCVLESGAASRCAKLVVKYLPDDMSIGPFCPETFDDVGGIWNWDGDKPGLYRLDRAFFEMLNGMGFKFYDDDGKIHRASPVGPRPRYDHACLQVEADKTVKMTVLLPVNPVFADDVTKLGTVAKVGLALDGVPIFADAPSVQDTGHLPALDTCGGHIDPGGWYHWHADAMDIASVYDKAGVKAACALPQSTSGQFAYAFDGFPIHGSTDEGGSVPAGLDECGGHLGPTADNANPHYHYHAASTFPNLPTCLKGLVARNNFATTAKVGIGSQSAVSTYAMIAAALAVLLALAGFFFWRRNRRKNPSA